MSTRRLAVIKESMESVALETQETDVAEAKDEYLEGVDVEENAAREELAAAAFAASMPTASMEAMPKELRGGMRVRFSHGHGKISKVLTAPFMHGGKQHHASKDDPRFLVKHDKGGKDSIHKASALTIRE